MSKSVRNNLLPNPDLQAKYLGLILGLTGIHLVLGFGIFYLSLQKGSKAVQACSVAISNPLISFPPPWIQILVWGVAFAVVIFLAVTLIGLHFSLRIAGPLTAIEKALSHPSGKAEIKVRRSDFFQELITDLNKFLQEEGRKSTP